MKIFLSHTNGNLFPYYFHNAFYHHHLSSFSLLLLLLGVFFSSRQEFRICYKKIFLRFHSQEAKKKLFKVRRMFWMIIRFFHCCYQTQISYSAEILHSPCQKNVIFSRFHSQNDAFIFFFPGFFMKFDNE